MPTFAGFEDGSIAWDDHYGQDNNDVWGILPDGTYDSNTRIQFCCRNDGADINAILLPISKPFYLIKKGANCQRVKNTAVTSEYIEIDSSNVCAICDRSWQYSGNHPQNDYEGENNRIYYCYYENSDSLMSDMSVDALSWFNKEVTVPVGPAPTGRPLPYNHVFEQDKKYHSGRWANKIRRRLTTTPPPKVMTIMVPG